MLSSISQSAANNNGSGDDNNAASGSNVKVLFLFSITRVCFNSNFKLTGLLNQAWAIPVGIVGGLILFGLIGYIAFRLCKKRDDADEEPIRCAILSFHSSFSCS